MKEKRWYAFGGKWDTLERCGICEAANASEARAYIAYYNRAWDCEEPNELKQYTDAECRAEHERRRAEEAKRKLNK